MSKILPSLVLLVFIPSTAVAQITPDSSLGAESSIVDSNGDRIAIEGGAIRDANLFHSFQEFNVGAGREAYFANPNGIANIFSRVTGNNLSNILGTLGVLGDANLFFMNPNGIVFGSNARLDVRGSFLGSTADSLVFENGFEFSAVNSNQPPLLTIGIPIGLNFRDNPGDIVNQSVANNGNGLEVATGETITLVGGNVDLDGGKIFAGGGRVELGGLSAAGEISINTDGSLSFPDGIARADVTLTNGAEVDVRAGGGGSTDVNARNIELSGGKSGISFLLAGIAPDSGSNTAQAGDIILNATDTISVSQGSAIANQVDSTGVGNAGEININTTVLFLTDGALIRATTFGEGDAGAIEITARDTISLSGLDSFSRIVSQVRSTAQVNSGRIKITTGSLSLDDGALIRATTFGEGDAGAIEITARDTISLSGLDNEGFGSQIVSRSTEEARGNLGGIKITTGSLALDDGALIVSDTFGEGDAGAIEITARDIISLSGQNGRELSFSAIGSQVDFVATGNSEGIKITTGSLALDDGARISATTFGEGDAGAIEITARDTISLSGLDSQGNFSGILSEVDSVATGNSGGIKITTDALFLTDGGVISTRTTGQGIAGNINITAKTLEANLGSQILTDTITDFDAGDINLVLSNHLTLTGDDTGLFAQTEGLGQAGDLTVNVGEMTITDGAVVTVSNSQGQAGNLNITSQTLHLNRGEITAVTGESGAEEGANITLEISELLTIENESLISAEALNTANGGNININSKFMIVFPSEDTEGSDIIANASEGRGGKIDINTQGIFGIEEREAIQGNRTNDIDASSEFGLAGVVEINQPDVDPNRGLIQLPETVVDPNALIAQNPCKRGSESEFVITGRGGLPPSLSEDLSSDATQVSLVEPAPIEAREQESSGGSPRPKGYTFGYRRKTQGNVHQDRGAEDKTSSSSSVPTTIIPAQGWIFNEQGEVVLVAYNPTVTGSQRLKENLTGCPTSGRN